MLSSKGTESLCLPNNARQCLASTSWHNSSQKRLNLKCSLFLWQINSLQSGQLTWSLPLYKYFLLLLKAMTAEVEILGLQIIRRGLPSLSVPILKGTLRNWEKRTSSLEFNSIVFLATHLFSKWREQLTMTWMKSRGKCVGQSTTVSKMSLMLIFPVFRPPTFILDFSLFFHYSQKH